MSEIITIAIGQCGIQMAQKFWELISHEHGISDCTYMGTHEFQRERLNVFYRQASAGYIPRAIFVDLDASTGDRLRASLFYTTSGLNYENLIVGTQGTNRNWAKGHYTDGAELIDRVLHTVRKEAAKADDPSFLIFHALGGGTGGGFGGLLINRLRETFEDSIIATVSVFPSSLESNHSHEPYNPVLSMQSLIENADLTFCIDNQALYNICVRLLGLRNPTNADLNHLIARAVSSMTAPLRFSGSNNNLSTLRQMVNSLVPYSRLHFLTPALTPLLNSASHSLTVAQLNGDMFDTTKYLVDVKLDDNQYLSAAALYRGQLSLSEIEQQLPKTVDISRVGVFASPLPDTKTSALLLANTTAILSLFGRILHQFSTLFSRMAYLHLYMGEGMDQMEFTEAESNLSDLIGEYRDYGQTIDEVEA